MKRKLSILGLILIMMMVAFFVFTACDSANVDDIVDLVQGSKGQLAAPNNFDYDGKFVSWGKVENATSYLVTLNGGRELEYTTTNCRYDNASGEDFTVSIKAKADKYDTSEATAYTFSPIDAVKSITVENDGTLKWDEVAYADSYEVTVGSTKTVVTQAIFSDLPVGQSQVTVRAKRASEQDIIYYSTGTATKTVTICADVDPTKIAYKDGTISWGSVSGAKAYALYIDDQPEDEDVKGTAFDFDAHNANFKVSIRAVGDHTSTFDSKTAIEKNFVYLETPTGVNVVSGELVWDEVDGADSYTLKVNGREVGPLTERRYKDIRAGQQTRVQIRANSSDTAYYAGWSAEKSFLLLAAPVIRWEDGNLDGSSAASIVWDGVDGAAGYSVFMTDPAGVENQNDLSSETRAYMYDYSAVGEYQVSVKACASTSSADVFDSAYSQAIKVVRLAAPKKSESNFIKSNPDNLAEGFDITFNAVSGATNYELWRDDTRVASTTSGRTQFASVNDFVDAAVMDEKIYTYRIKSLGASYNAQKRTKILDSLSSETLNFDITVLAMPQNVRMEGYNIRFDTVSKAGSYTVSVGSSLRNSETNSYKMDFVAPGTYQVKVNARGNGTNVLSSNYTVEFTLVRLPAPTDIKISTVAGSEGVLSFTGSDKASSYDLTINGEVKNIKNSDLENIAKEIQTTGTQMHLRAVRNEYGTGSEAGIYYMDSPDSETKTFTKLPAPTFGQTAFSNTQLIWNAITAFSGFSPNYRVYDDSNAAYDGVPSGATFDISSFEGGKSYIFKVKAIGDGTRYINSDFSEPVSVYKLATPQVKINDTKDAYVWKGVTETTQYAVYIDGKPADLQYENYGDGYIFKPKFTQVGTHDVKVYAKGDGGTSTIDSDPCEIKQEAAQLDTPNFTFRYTKEAVSDDGEIEMTISYEPAYANGYVYIVKDAQSSAQQETTYAINPTNVGSYPLSVYAVGGKFGKYGEKEDVYYIDSQVCGGNANYTIILLGQPNQQGIDLSKSGLLTWGVVSSASAYELTVTINGTKEIKETVTQGNTLNIKAILDEEGEISYKDVTEVTVSIIATGGNSARVVKSRATESTFTNLSH